MKKEKGHDEKLKLIKYIVNDNKINTHEIEAVASIEYPLFSFRWLQKYSFDECLDVKFFHDFLLRLRKLSELGWREIRLSGRHQYGIEKIPIGQLKPTVFPQIVTPDIERLDVFRATGDNLPMIGLQQGKIFHVIFIETRFGDIYCHG